MTTSNSMTPRKAAAAFFLCTALATLLVGVAKASANDVPTDLPILRQWHGDYPVSELKCLPEGQRSSRVGYLSRAEPFRAVWRAFKPGETPPEIDFTRNLVFFSRNVDFYNRISMAKVILNAGVADILAAETRSAMPIEDRVAMALAVVPREGVRFLRVGKERIAVTGEGACADPRNATYTIEGQEIPLIHGRAEKEAAPGSAIRVTTTVFGEPVYGDLMGDGRDDAVLVLVHNPGGSGTFYYVAAAINVDGTCRGTNAVLLGDRIAPQGLEIRNGVLIATYAERRPEEPMAARPSVGVSKYLTLRDGKLTEIRPLAKGERVVQGWVTMGHEVRSFAPCGEKRELWLMGNAAVLNTIMAAHRTALPDRKRYAPLFMILAGRVAPRPSEGFGAQYDGAFVVSQLVQVWRKGNCKSRDIVVDAPYPGDLVTSPLRVRGRARGTWFFEGDFPLILKDARGGIIARRYCTAKGPWMTKDFVPFEGSLTFEKPKAPGRGTLIFKKDNPSDRPELDDALEIPVSFD